MNLIITFIFNIMISLFNLLNSFAFYFNGYAVYWGWLLVAVSILSMFCSVLWRGAKK